MRNRRLNAREGWREPLLIARPFPIQNAPASRRGLQGRSSFRMFSGFAIRAFPRFRGFYCVALRYCSKSTSLLSRKKAKASRAIRAMPPKYQPSDWMPKFMTRADAMVGANAPPVMAARL